ncbi:MAG: hypothetical protein ACYTBJ_25995 [Planctomycetota bacterium]|jgi:hypothetical protein
MEMTAFEIAIPFVLFVGFVVAYKVFKSKAKDTAKPVPKVPLGEREERDPVGKDRHIR